ncbi:enhancer of mRNA-decapping protein 4 isoform X2 [Alligator mississippiensis]|uniref:enhancer of mRNA-decapping protein 4 isoform X2 n=1 Tax=Alligator mississippiensis TaxID=8496 RepID=UPI002877472A|nr:enhancer of mRNA-decapping protein 4 isoform X2 [Alligator mississippiensis]
MASASIDIEDATQHLRDILKLDRPGGSVNENQRPSSSYNGDLNGLLVPDPITTGDGASLAKPMHRSVPLGTLQEKQVICLSGDDSSTCLVISAKDVEIVASSDSSITSKARGSNKVKIQPVARYDWEQKYYYGNLIAVSNSYLAYAIRGATNGSAMVRVLSVSTAERTLLKGFTGGVADLAFAHLNSNQLACLDEAGNLFVWRLAMVNGKIQEEILVNIKRPDGTPLNNFRRIIWCPFIPDENEESSEEGSQILALLHEDRAEVWDLDIIRANDSSWPVEVTNIKEGFIVVKGHSTRLSEGALSPDGTVLATASHDGYVKFWQIYIEGQDEPRCLHEWKPHDGKPLSCLLFCDNHKKQDPEVPFWRFLITGADQNRELKMWCTVSWTCLQTVRFSSDIFSSMTVLPSLKVCLDLSAEYLILSDVQRKVLYVMELMQNQEEGKAYFSSISEFLLTHPVLSFGIQAVSRCRLRHTEVLLAEEENDSLSVEGAQGAGAVESAAGVLIKLFCVHTKALQDVQIRFQPLHSPDMAASIPSHGSHEDFAFPDHLADLGTEGLGSEKGSIHGSQSDLRRISDLPVPADFLSLSNDAKPKLMTPDAFMTPSTSLQQITVSPGSSVSSLTAVTAMSSTSVNDAAMSSHRPSEDLTLNPKMQLDTSITLSSSGSSLQTSPRNHSVLIPGLPDKLTAKAPVPVAPGNPPLSLELKEVEPLVVPQASPTRERSPDVISSASTAMSQDIPEIASETLQRSFAAAPTGLPAEVLEPNHHADSMASAASALHLLSPRNRHNSEHSHHSLDMAPVEVDRLNTPSLLETALTQENASSDSVVSQPWPAAPDITRETRNSMADSPRDEVEEKHKSSSYHRHSYHLLQHDSQDASAEQSDHDDEVASLASTSGGFGAKVSAQRLPVKDWKAKASPRASPKLKRKGKKEDGDVTQSPRSSDHQVTPEYQDELMSLLRNQQRELTELRQNQMELMRRLTDHLDAVQSSLMGHVERVVGSQQEQEQRRLDRALTEWQQRNEQLQDHLSQQLSQSMSTAVCNRLERTIREEMKKTVPQCISKSMDPVTGQLSNTIATKLTAVEGTLKENVTKLVKSKNLTDTIARAAADALQGPIQSAYREAFQSIVLPAFEKSCQSMFQQINDTFKQGTQEYIQQLETHMKNKKVREQEARDPLLSQLRQLITTFQSTTEQLASTITASVHAEVQHQLHIIVGNMQESILTQVQRVIKGEVSLAMKEQQAAVTSSIMQAMRSAAGTPIPSAHLDFQSQQAHILQLLQQGHLNQAFQQALTAADLNLVLYVCETVDPQQVFGQHPCPLSQPVLLSLIQQLSSDLGTRTELKLSYLEEAVMHLDHSDPITRDHMGSVMSQVRQKLFQFLQAEPHNSLGKAARRLMIMLQGLVTPSMT